MNCKLLLWTLHLFFLCSNATFIAPQFSDSSNGLSKHLHSQSKILVNTWARRSGHPNRNVEYGKQKHQKQEEIQAILSNMGIMQVGSEQEVKTRKKVKDLQTKSPISARRHRHPLSQSVPSLASQISLKTQLDYARNGHGVLRKFIKEEALQNVRKVLRKHAAKQELVAWKQKVAVASNSPQVASSCRSVQACQQKLEELGITQSIPFLQFFNTWREIDAVRDLSYSLAEAASVLLDVPSIRLYQDAVFWKRTDDGPTPWHVDARMAPFDTTNFITFWIPLQDIPVDGTALTFCSKSHADFALPYWNPVSEADDRIDGMTSEWTRLEQRYPERLVHYMPMQLGDVTFHSGWTLHCANNNESRDRMALAISYVDASAEVREDVLDKSGGKGDNEDTWSYGSWVGDVTPRARFHHKLVPILWPPSERRP